jgi:hypothetical protein
MLLLLAVMFVPPKAAPPRPYAPPPFKLGAMFREE